MSFKNKTILITGASRGIGKAIALKLARDGANIIVAAKSTEENPKLGGTIYSAADEIKAAGGTALAMRCDIRDELQVQKVVDAAVAEFGGIDILINNASAITLSSTEKTEPKRYDLMFDVNVRGTFFVSQACIPYLKKSSNPHILTLSPPLNMDMKWFAGHLAYTLTKYNMTMITLGLAAEFKKNNIAANTLWPQTTIATAAVQNLLGGDTLIKMSRTAAIIADAAYFILARPSAECTGNSFIDEKVLNEEGVTDLESYSVVAGAKLYKDLFL
jgi:citronellol/citronellal dehydrogenase